MSPRSKQEYIRAIVHRYVSASKAAKHQILTEVCATTGYHRKAAIRRLRQARSPHPTPPRRRRPPRTRPAAERCLHQWVRAWQETAPAAVATLRRDWEALLAFYQVAERDWRRVRTTNAIERAFREIRRRTRPMTCFTNLASCDRIMYAVIHALNLRAAGRPLHGETTQNS